ncbi:MAG: FGGY-family carbohydrate kinase, partial [Lentisphaerae bacterium]|nr:FGGY-family carbohydrate kinase [Lentisphaerota bacterium]
VDRLKSATGMTFERIHVVGGGSRSDCLCGLISKSLAIPVIAGPSEATAIGNILSQARTLGILKNDNEIGAVIEKSFPPKIYEARK